MAVIAEVGMAQVQCSGCAIVYWVPEQWKAERGEDHKTFWCPNGHTQWYPGKTTEQKLREQLDQQRRCCDSNRARAASLTEALEHRERQIRGYKGVVARRRNEVQRLSNALGKEIDEEIAEAEAETE